MPGPHAAQPRTKRKEKEHTEDASLLGADAALNSLPAHLRDSLMPFQRDGVKFVLAKHGRACIGDEMGTCVHTHVSLSLALGLYSLASLCSFG